jgi:hypothetical protein
MGDPALGVQPLAESFLSSEDFFVETIVAAWGQNCLNLAPWKRKVCQQDLRIEAHQVFQDLALFKGKDLQQAAQNFAMCLNQTVHLSSQDKADTEKKMADLDKEIEAVHLPPVQHHQFKGTSLGSYATVLTGLVAGGTAGFATSGIIGVLEKDAVMQVKYAALENAVNARMGTLQATWDRIQQDARLSGRVERLLKRNLKFPDDLLRRLAQSRVDIQIAKEAVPIAEAVADMAVASAVATKILPVVRTTAFTTAGAALGAIANVVLLLLATDDAE